MKTNTHPSSAQIKEANRVAAQKARCTASEDAAKKILLESFGQLFDKVVVHTNLIFPTESNSAVRSAEVDAIVVCGAGIFIFEVKSWTNCKVIREKVESGPAEWALQYNHGPQTLKKVRDPVHQLGGKLRIVNSLVCDAVAKHIHDHTNEAVMGLDSLSDDRLGQRLTQSVEALVSKVSNPNIRMRSYVYLPMGGVDLPMNVPSNVLVRDELNLVLRQLHHEIKREKTPRVPFSDAMVDRIAEHLKSMGSQISYRQHLENIQSVHGGCEASLSVIGP